MQKRILCDKIKNRYTEGDKMRMRNLKNKEEILNNSKILINNPKEHIGKWKELFKNNNPIYIEIGMGKGKFIMENALKNKNINYIGIERFDNVLARALPKLEEKNIENLYIIRINALELDEVFDHEIDRIYLNFSDPWPKKRHHERRLTSKTLLKKYDNLFKSDKTIYQRTDNEDLFIYSLETLSNHGYGLNDITLDLHSKEEDLITTEYEDKFTKDNKKIYAVKAIEKCLK